jgi:hypothetical protein
MKKEEQSNNDMNKILWISNNPQCKLIESCYNSISKKCICPQEEPKQETLTYTEAAKKEERIFNSTMMSNQETLKEAAEKEFPHKPFVKVDITNKKREAFIEGYKLAQQRMYSEEEVIKAYHDAYHKGYTVGQKDAELHPLALTIANNIHIDRNKWFEQFKKKGGDK